MFNLFIQSADAADQKYLLGALRKLRVEEVRDPFRAVHLRHKLRMRSFNFRE